MGLFSHKQGIIKSRVEDGVKRNKEMLHFFGRGMCDQAAIGHIRKTIGTHTHTR